MAALLRCRIAGHRAAPQRPHCVAQHERVANTSLVTFISQVDSKGAVGAIPSILTAKLGGKRHASARISGIVAHPTAWSRAAPADAALLRAQGGMRSKAPAALAAPTIGSPTDRVVLVGLLTAGPNRMHTALKRLDQLMTAEARRVANLPQI